MTYALRNQKGVALVTSLMLTLITLGMITALLYVITQTTRVTAAVKRYHNVTEAAYGGAELVAQDVIATLWTSYTADSANLASQLTGSYAGIDLAVAASNPCLAQKLTTANAGWSACSAAQKSVDLANLKTAPDLTFLLKGTDAGTNYKVYAKIVDTSAGNTDTASGSMLNAADHDGLVVAGGSAYQGASSGTVPLQRIPYVYRLEVQGEKEVNPAEKSNVSVLYAY